MQKSKKLRPLLAACAALLLVLPAGPVFAGTLEDATVNLYCQLKSGRKTYSVSGSGAFISPRGVIITNAHVAQYFLLQGKKVKGTTTCTVRTGSPAKDAYTAEVVHVSTAWLGQFASSTRSKIPAGSGEHDFALLRVTGSVSGVLPATFPALPPDFLEIPFETQHVSLGAYPSEDLSFNEVKRKLRQVVTSSTIQNVSGYGYSRLPEAITVAPSPAGAPGASGGPVLNTSGEVLGVITSKSAQKGNRTTRAISLFYVDQLLRSQTGFSGAAILAGDIAQRASSFQASVAAATLKAVARNFTAKK